MKYMRLGEMLIAAGVIDQKTLEHALTLQKGSGKRLGAVLIENGFVTESQLIDVLQAQLGVDFIDLSTVRISPEMTQLVSRNIARKYLVVPVRLAGDELYVAMADPLNFNAIEEIKASTGKRVITLISYQASVERAIANLYGNAGAAKAIQELHEEIGQDTVVGRPVSTVTVNTEDGSAPTIRLVNSIIDRAVAEKASDIHIEPREDQMIVRIRIDGLLRQVLVIPREIQDSVIARIKVMGGMDIAERRIPQDGRANVKIKQQEIDLRISTLPTIYGEKIVIRLLNKSTSLLSLDGIGLMGDNKERFSRLIRHNSNGVILVVGPTGSGKSASMSTMVSEINNEQINLVTLEDPVEYNIPGVNQVQINEKAGLTFAGGLRSILRQDPDVVAVGEIRDAETAEIALRAAITGHLVLSTIHTNDALSSIDRLLDLGIEPYLIAAALKGIVSQRLVRRVCPHCRQEYTPDEEQLKMMQLDPEQNKNAKFYKGAGCPECFHTGYRGRVAMFEILTFTREIKRVITERQNYTKLVEAVGRSGYQPMIKNGQDLVLQGITTCEEVYRTINTTDI